MDLEAKVERRTTMAFPWQCLNVRENSFFVHFCTRKMFLSCVIATLESVELKQQQKKLITFLSPQFHFAFVYVFNREVEEKTKPERKRQFCCLEKCDKKKLKLHDVECLRRKRKRKCFPKINIRQSQQWFFLGFQLFGSRYCEHAMVISLIYRKSLIGLRLRLRPFSAMTLRVSRRARKALKSVSPTSQVFVNRTATPLEWLDLLRFI